jgi:hypothetical protein
MKTASDIIDTLGGTGEVSRALELPASTVSTWKQRGIPPRQWASVVTLADIGRRKDITFELLSKVYRRHMNKVE